MTNLRRYNTRDILSAVTELFNELDDGDLGSLQFMVTLNDFRFRDAEGDYWFLDPHLENWFRFERGRWRQSSADAEPRTLEGPVSLTRYISATPVEILPEHEAPVARQNGEEPTATEMMEVMVRASGSGYRQGRISSKQAEQSLAGVYVADHNGRAWTVGIRSGGWYYFEDGQWRVADHPPELESLVPLRIDIQQCPTCGLWVRAGDECPQCDAVVLAELSAEVAYAHAVMLRFFLSGADRFPEYVTDPWDPPAGFPEALVEPDLQCGACGARNAARSRFCNQCGTRLGCLSCGTPNPPHHRFCSQCGVPLEG
jgi:hypothetical protein